MELLYLKLIMKFCNLNSARAYGHWHKKDKVNILIIFT